MPRLFDHIDLRVPSLSVAAPFYETLLPALGFVRRVQVEGWLQFEAVDHQVREFFGITEAPGHVANENRISFWAATVEDVDHIAEAAREAGARHMEGPLPYERGYYAAFFEDPCGNKFEVCHRVRV